MEKKVFLFCLFSIFTSTLVFSQQIIFNVGDNIAEYLSKNPTQYLTQGTYLINSPDGRVDFLKYKPETSEVDTIFLVQGNTLFGVMQNENNETVVLYDMTGDGILDVIHDSLILPFWVLSESDHTNKSGINNLLPFLINGLVILNEDANPYSNGAMNAHIRNFLIYLDVSTNNIDLLYGMVQYYVHAQYPSLSLMIITELGIRYQERFNSIHPLILLHTAESLINHNQEESAKIFIDGILSTSSNFIPAKVYSWQLETNSAEKRRKYRALKNNHPNHWIVRQI